jgi:hypothetical protein
MISKRLDSILIIFLITTLAFVGYKYATRLIDFHVYYYAGQSLLSGRTDLYAPDFARGILMDYRYPPLFLLLLIPIWTLPYITASYVWYILSVIELALCCLVLHRIIKNHYSDLSRANLRFIWLVSILITAKYIVLNLRYGNAHLLVTSLFLISLYLYLRFRYWSSALMMALAISIKITPILILPYFILKREWKLLILTGTLIILLNLIPSIFFGFKLNIELLQTWYHHVIVNQEFHEINGPVNLSLKGQLRRYLTNMPYNERLDKDTSYPDINIMALKKSLVDMIWKIAGTAIYTLSLCLIGWREYVNRKRREVSNVDDPWKSFELGIMISLMVLIGPLSSFLYFIVLLWPLVHLSVIALKEDLGVIKAAIGLMMAISCILPLLPGRYIQRLILVLGADFYLLSILLLSSIYIYYRLSIKERYI